jgi:hypothetical protein
MPECLRHEFPFHIRLLETGDVTAFDKPAQAQLVSDGPATMRCLECVDQITLDGSDAHCLCGRLRTHPTAASPQDELID